MPTTSVSPRIQFQWKYFDKVTPILNVLNDLLPNIVNIGCADDPTGLGDLVLHVDMDDWSYLHKYFYQADAHHLPNKWTGDFELVILGDVLEHVLDPMQVTSEAMRITGRGGYLVATIFEEWRLPGPGQWVEESHRLADEVNKKMGYEDREHYQRVNYPEKIAISDNSNTPHLSHINQFTDDEMSDMVRWVVRGGDFRMIEGTKHIETVHEEHNIYNWLFAFERTR